MEELAHAPIFIDDTAGLALSEMRAKARRTEAIARRSRSANRGLLTAHVR